MQKTIVLIGIGEIGGVFAKALLRAGYPVHPITRSMDMAAEAAALPDPELVLITVAEKDLPSVLADLPATWKDRTGLVQNELLPRDWQQHGIANPTVISVWFEKKPGKEPKVLIPSPAYGPKAQLLVQALEGINIAARELDNEADLLTELVLKNVYILTTNISGLKTGGNVSELWENHRELATSIANETMDIQSWLTGETLDRKALIAGMQVAFEGDPKHMCMGRSAPARLQRAIEQAEQAGVSIPMISDIAAEKL